MQEGAVERKKKSRRRNKKSFASLQPTFPSTFHYIHMIREDAVRAFVTENYGGVAKECGKYVSSGNLPRTEFN